MCARHAGLVSELMLSVYISSYDDSLRHSVIVLLSLNLGLFSNWGTPLINFLDNDKEVFSMFLHVTHTNVFLTNRPASRVYEKHVSRSS